MELAAAEAMLDEQHDTPPIAIYDTNLYTCGRIGDHNVAIVCLPSGQTGSNSAASVAALMRSTFTSIRFGLLVGIGGGVPSEERDIRLGDVVVSVPHNIYGGIVQYDFGKATSDGFQRMGSCNAPPTILLNAVAKVRARHDKSTHRMMDMLSKLSSLPQFDRKAVCSDNLFEAHYKHSGGSSCENCSQDYLVVRRERRQGMVVHYGTIASGNQVMKDAIVRDRISRDLGGVLCFKMEAAGLMNNFPCIVVRGICNYADSHTNKTWQSYAAGTAAVYAKELLSMIPGESSPGVAMADTFEEQPTSKTERGTLLLTHGFSGSPAETPYLQTASPITY